MREHILQSLPYPARVLVGLLCYRKMVSTMHLQGTGRYSADEIAETRLEIWVNNLLLFALLPSPVLLWRKCELEPDRQRTFL